MTEQLPISIYTCDDLMQQFAKITSVCSRLEAQFNFQTMTANWYGDEDNIMFIKIHIETPQSFVLRKNNQSQASAKNYSDDAFSYFDNSKKKQTLICYIAITHTELTLLNKQKNLLAGLLNIKLQKVLNLIAKQLKLTAL